MSNVLNQLGSPGSLALLAGSPRGGGGASDLTWDRWGRADPASLVGTADQRRASQCAERRASQRIAVPQAVGLAPLVRRLFDDRSNTLGDATKEVVASIDDLVRRIPGYGWHWRERRRGIRRELRRGVVGDGCCARDIVTAKQTMTMAAIANTERICEIAVEATSPSIMPNRIKKKSPRPWRSGERGDARYPKEKPWPSRALSRLIHYLAPTAPQSHRAYSDAPQGSRRRFYGDEPVLISSMVPANITRC